MKATEDKILFAWSGGKDSSMALNELLQNNSVSIAALLTTVTEGYGRISMHGVREELLDEQARSLGIPLEKLFISKDVNKAASEYESKMDSVLKKYRLKGVSSVAFGDIFLEDLKKYREDKLKKVGSKGVFPIWKRDTKELAKNFIDLGFKAIITCVDGSTLDGSFSGRDFDLEFLSDLPASVDPCGENGEFHSFVYDGPCFKQKIDFTRGETVLRDERFYYTDLIAKA